MPGVLDRVVSQRVAIAVTVAVNDLRQQKIVQTKGSLKQRVLHCAFGHTVDHRGNVELGACVFQVC